MEKSTYRVLAVVGTALFAGALLGSARVHFDLERSLPEADSEVTSPDAVMLWFTQVPQANSTSIRLVNGEGELVQTSDVSQDPEDGKLQSVTVQSTLAPGAYTVAWRSMAADGHVVRDDFSFEVVAEYGR